MSRPVSPASNSSRSASAIAARRIIAAVTADGTRSGNGEEARESGPLFFWRGGTWCGIETGAPTADPPRASRFSFGVFFMRCLLLSVVTAATMLAALPADAQEPMTRVQVGVLECRGGASIGFIVGSVTNLGCVLRVE